MKQLTVRLFIIAAIFGMSNNVIAQGSPVDYLSSISNKERGLHVKYLSYMSAASHGRSMRKIERRRAELIKSIDDTRSKINDLPSYNGDKSLRDSAVNYLKIMYSLFNDDYAKLVNMEEIAEQSYDLMEAYLLAQQKASEKLREASEAYNRTHKAFAANNKINLVETKSEMGEKLEKVNKVQSYYNTIYLIFFKAYKQEYFLIEALRAKNTNAVEQNRSALAQHATEGLAKLKELKGFEGDRSIEAACKQMLQFYLAEAEKDFDAISDYLLTEENFEKAKKSFETSAKTKQDADTYNKAVNDINKALNKLTSTIQRVDEKRKDLAKNYEDAVSSFMDTHMPYAR